MVIKTFTALFNKGSDYLKYTNEDNDHEARDGQFDTDQKRGFFKNRIGDKFADLRSHAH